ncbi:MAG TPA: FKBP-type peptidyl-prolyl cis-trans isomerase [Bacteroidales bacterium]|nr:FKBP-type peptidyl-prolyl cis-trans isomerase [Bacteroidales bacterium]HPE85813.1 FKBP-type peptidyl-prolyl cis-trans isomerase [Bacteroidales bacterium]
MMKKPVLISLILMFMAMPAITLAQKQAKKLIKIKPEKVLRTRADSASYALGVDIVRTMQLRGINFNPEVLATAIMRESYGCDTILSDEQVINYLNALQEDINKKDKEAQAMEIQKNKQQGIQYLAENKNKAGVIQTESGLQYKVIREGDGTHPTGKSTVRVHYRGTFLNGEVFDSSYDRGESIEFPLDGVIKGWTEGLQLMKPGAKYILYIPSSLAYGDHGMGPIPGGATLIFEVELITVLD